MTQTEALELALEGLEEWRFGRDPRAADKYITAIKEILAQSTSGDYALGYSIGFGDGHSAKEFMAQPEQEPVAFEMDWPDYHAEAMGCGLEDRNITDRYEAMQYGWDEAIERIAERLPEAFYITPPQRKPLTHEQRFDLLTKFEPYKNKWGALAILIDMVEAAHGIKE